MTCSRGWSSTRGCPAEAVVFINGEDDEATICPGSGAWFLISLIGDLNDLNLI
jgi:hypothetical protein